VGCSILEEHRGLLSCVQGLYGMMSGPGINLSWDPAWADAVPAGVSLVDAIRRSLQPGGLLHSRLMVRLVLDTVVITVLLRTSWDFYCSREAALVARLLACLPKSHSACQLVVSLMAVSFTIKSVPIFPQEYSQPLDLSNKVMP
jgi:hypothetical protein